MQEIETGTIELRFANYFALPTKELAEVLTALSEDYAKLAKGRVLTVSNVREGSIILAIKDALVAAATIMVPAKEVAEGVAAVVKLAGAVRDALIKEKNAPEDAPVKRRRQIGSKTADRLFQTALNSGGDVSLKYREDAESASIDIVVTNADAERWDQRRMVDEILRSGLHASQSTIDVGYAKPLSAPSPQLTHSPWLPAEMLVSSNSGQVLELARNLHSLRMTHLAGTIQNEFLRARRGDLAEVFMREVENLQKL